MENRFNFLWIRGELRTIELMSLESFHLKGYSCKLWSYEKISNVPSYVKIGNANKITPLIETHDRMMSDIFRYHLIYKTGEWWSDMDNICMERLPEVEWFIPGREQTLNNHILRMPKGNLFLKELLEIINNTPIKDHYFNFKFLYDLAVKWNLEDKIVRMEPYEGINPNDIHWLNVEGYDISFLKDAKVIHLVNSLIRYSMRISPIFQKNLEIIKSYYNG